MIGEATYALSGRIQLELLPVACATTKQWQFELVSPSFSLQVKSLCQ
jgi:hypothetical protein